MRALMILSFVVLTLGPATPGAAQESQDETLFNCGYLCGEDGTPLYTATDTPPETDLVTRIFLGAFSEACSWAIAGGQQQYLPEVFDFTYRDRWDEADAPEHQLRLYQFFCGAGAYNGRHVYLTWTSDSGVRAVSFPVPTFTVEYERENDIDTPLKSLALTGMSARHELVNSELDVAAKTITEWSCWRGLCDASGSGVWVLDGDTFRLQTYDIDPTYDGEVNQFRVVDYSTPAAVDTSSPLPFEPPVFDEEE